MAASGPGRRSPKIWTLPSASRTRRVPWRMKRRSRLANKRTWLSSVVAASLCRRKGLCGAGPSSAERSHGLAVLFFSLCHPLERGNLSEELSFWLRRASKHFSACSHVRNDAGLRTDLRILADPQMPSHGRLTPDANEILKHGRTRNTDLRDDNTTPAEDDIVADLDEVIEPRASADHRVPR